MHQYNQVLECSPQQDSVPLLTRTLVTHYDFSVLSDEVLHICRHNGAHQNGFGRGGPVHIMTNPNRGRGGAAGAVRGGMPASKSAPAFSENGPANGHVKAASPANGPNVAQTRGRGGLAFRGGFDPRGGPSRGGFAPRGGRGFAPGMDRGSPRGFGRGRGRGHFTAPSAS